MLQALGVFHGVQDQHFAFGATGPWQNGEGILAGREAEVSLIAEKTPTIWWFPSMGAPIAGWFLLGKIRLKWMI